MCKWILSMYTGIHRHYNLPWQLVPVLSHPHIEKSVAWCKGRTVCISLYVHCLCHWVLLRKAWLCLLCIIPSGIYIHWLNSHWNFFSPGSTLPAFSVFCHRDMPQCLHHFSGPLLNSVGIAVSFLGCGVQNWWQRSRYHQHSSLTNSEYKGRISSLSLPVNSS